MTNKEAIAHGKEQLDVFGGEHAEFIKLAIKALENRERALSCEDAISRKAVKELFQEGSVMGMYYFLGIDELPSITSKKEEWIPCSEKMPKQKEYIGNVCEYYLIQDEYGDMCVARYTKKGWHPIESLFFLDDVVAWIPLPKRYEHEGDNNDK